MTGRIKGSKNIDKTKNAFSPVPSADSFPWKRVGNDSNIDITQNSSQNSYNRLEPPRMDKKKDTLYSAYDSFLDDKRNTFLSESSYTFDTLNRTSYIEDSEYEPIVENQMAIITNEQPKPQRYSMLSALAPLKRVSLDKPRLTQDSQTYDSLRYTDEESSNYNDYSYVSYESDYEAIDENAQPIIPNQLAIKSDAPRNQSTKSLEKKIEENIAKYKKENIYGSSTTESEIMEDFSLKFQRDSVRDSRDPVTDVITKKLKKDDDSKEVKKDDGVKSKGQIEREKAAKEAKEIEALKPSYVDQIHIKPVVNEITPQMVVDAEKDATKTADESISNIKPQFVENVTIQPNVASITPSMIKQPTQSIYLSSKEIAPMEESSDDLFNKMKGKERSESDDEFYKAKEGLKNMSIEEINENDLTKELKKSESPKEPESPMEVNELHNEPKIESEGELKDEPPKEKPSSKPLLTAPQIEPPKIMPQTFIDSSEREIKVLEHPNPLIYSGYLEKLSTHGRFQKRLFRFDGLIFTCLSQNKQKIPSNSSLLSFQPLFLKDGTEESYEFINTITKFYPNGPVSPEIVNPLVALEKNISNSGAPDLKSRQYYYPKWMLNIHEIETIQPLLSIQNISRGNENIDDILRSNNQDQNELTFIVNTKKISYILRAPNNRDFNRWMYILNRMKETYIELEEESMNPKPSVPRPRFKNFPPPPMNPPPPELQAKRYRNCQEYVQNNLGFSLTIPKSVLMEASKPLIVQICKDVRDQYFRRIALLKIWNICFTDLLSIDTSVSNNAVIIPVNKTIMAREGPKLPQIQANMGMPMNMGNMPPSSMGMNMGMNMGMGMGMGMGGMPQGLLSPSMGIKSGTKNNMGIPIATPGLASPNMGPPGVMSPPMGPPGVTSPPMGPPGMGPQGMISPSMNEMMSPNLQIGNSMSIISPGGPRIDDLSPISGNMMFSPNANGKESYGSNTIEPNIKDLMNYGNKDETDNEDDDRFYLPKKEDGSLNPFIGRNSVIGNTNSLLHFKKLSLMDVNGDFNSLYRALGNENNSPSQKKATKQGSTDHFAQELEMLDNMNTKSSMNKIGIETRQVNMTRIDPGVTKTTSLLPDESMMTEDVSVDFPAPPNPYGRTTLGSVNSSMDRNKPSTNGLKEKIEIPVDPELLHCLTAMLRIIHRLSGSCFREEQKSFESVPPPVPKWYYQFCVKSFPSFAKLSQTHVINYLECMEEKYTVNGQQELPQEYLKIQEALESFIKATRAWERVVNDWKRDIIHRKHLNHKKISFDDDDSIMKVVRINDVLRVNLLLKDHIEENARKETSKLRKFFQPPQPRKIK